MANKKKQETATAPQNGNNFTSLLDLSTQRQHRPFINILDAETGESVRYELRTMDEFSLPDQCAMGRFSAQINRLQDPDSEPNQKAESRLSQTLESVFCRIVVNGHEIVDRLSASKKLEVFEAFFAHQKPKKEASPPLKTSESQDSSASTEDAQATG